MGSKPKTAKEDPSVARLRARQFQDLARLDEEQNTRIKRLMNAGYGRRAFKGSVATRLAPGDTPAAPAPAPVAPEAAPTGPAAMAKPLYHRLMQQAAPARAALMQEGRISGNPYGSGSRADKMMVARRIIKAAG